MQFSGAMSFLKEKILALRRHFTWHKLGIEPLCRLELFLLKSLTSRHLQTNIPKPIRKKFADKHTAKSTAKWINKHEDKHAKNVQTKAQRNVQRNVQTNLMTKLEINLKTINLKL